MNAKPILALPLVLLLSVSFPTPQSWSAAAGADVLRGYRERSIATGPLRSRGWTEGEIAWASRFLPGALDRVEQRLGRRRGRPFTTVLTDGHEELRRIVTGLGGRDPGPSTQGVAIPGRDLMVVRGDLTRLAVPGDPTRVTLEHEVAHLVIHRRPGVRVPRWLDEGLAVRVSQGRLAPRDEAYLSFLARTGGLYRIETLERSFPAGDVATTVAYHQSFLLVEFLVALRGEDAPGRLLDRLEEGATPQAALERVSGQRPKAFEEAFGRWCAARRSLFEVLVALFNPWTFAGLLAIVAIARHIVKKRKDLRRMAAEDEAAESPDVAP